MSRRPVITRLDRAGLLALAPEWDRLVADSATPGPFLSWAWIGAWLDTLGSDTELVAAAARDRDDGRLVGVAPFHIERRVRAGIPHTALRLIGSGPAAPDHLDMPVARDAPAGTASVLWECLERSWDVIDFDGVAAGSTLAALLLRRSGDIDRTEMIPVPYLPLDPTWEATALRFSAGHRQNLGRYSRKLDREAGVPVTERMVGDRSEVIPTMTVLADLHQRIRTAAGDRGAFASPDLLRFHTEVALRMYDAGRLRLWRLDAGGTPIAIIECFRFGDVVVFYTTGYDPAWARFGPGRRVMAAAIAGAIDEGAAEFDFLRGDESYKAAWGAEARHDLRIRRPVGPRGRLLWVGRSLLNRRPAGG